MASPPAFQRMLQQVRGAKGKGPKEGSKADTKADVRELAAAAKKKKGK